MCWYIVAASGQRPLDAIALLTHRKLVRDASWGQRDDRGPMFHLPQLSEGKKALRAIFINVLGLKSDSASWLHDSFAGWGCRPSESGPGPEPWGWPQSPNQCDAGPSGEMMCSQDRGCRTTLAKMGAVMSLSRKQGQYPGFTTLPRPPTRASFCPRHRFTAASELVGPAEGPTERGTPPRRPPATYVRTTKFWSQL